MDLIKCSLTFLKVFSKIISKTFSFWNLLLNGLFLFLKIVLIENPRKAITIWIGKLASLSVGGSRGRIFIIANRDKATKISRNCMVELSSHIASETIPHKWKGLLDWHDRLYPPDVSKTNPLDTCPILWGIPAGSKMLEGLSINKLELFH